MQLFKIISVAIFHLKFVYLRPRLPPDTQKASELSNPELSVIVICHRLQMSLCL